MENAAASPLRYEMDPQGQFDALKAIEDAGEELLGIYHSVLTERGVTDYPLEQLRDDYGMALLLPASRLATAVGLHPGLTATPDGFWNVVFPRYARALTDLGVSELLEQRYG